MIAFRTVAALVVGVIGVGMVAGCQPPQGDTGGRVDVTRTTPAERNDARVNTASLFEFSDQVAQQLAADLSSVPELNGEYRATLVFGDMVNKTTIVSTNDFEAFRTRIRSKLMQSRTFMDKVRFVRDKASADALIRRESSSSDDLLQEGRRQERTPLNPAYTYFLDGEFYRVERGGSVANTYSMSFNLMNMESGELIWSSESYDVKQVR